MLNLKCSGLNTQHFCKSSASMHAQHISKSDLGLKLHTEKLHARWLSWENLSYRMSLEETSTKGTAVFCLHFLPLPLQGLLMLQEATQVPCAPSFPPALLVPPARVIPCTEHARLYDHTPTSSYKSRESYETQCDSSEANIPSLFLPFSSTSSILQSQLIVLPLGGKQGFSPLICHPCAQKGLLSHYQNCLRLVDKQYLTPA